MCSNTTTCLCMSQCRSAMMCTGVYNMLSTADMLSTAANNMLSTSAGDNMLSTATDNMLSTAEMLSVM